MQDIKVNVIPVILSGGSGTRLWPLSRQHYPKQLLKLSGGQYTMLQETALRVSHLQPPIVVCNEDHRFMVAEQLKVVVDKPTAIILEPVARNTAPAIALAALQAIKHDAEAIIVVLPADHMINDQLSFEQSLSTAVEWATREQLVTFGVIPTAPEIGYGYIKAGKEVGGARQVDCFVEKPDLTRAKQYLGEDNYYWNSGMFVFKASVYLAGLRRMSPAIVSSCELALAKADCDLDFVRVDVDAFKQSPGDSIDYALMEHANNVVVVPMDAGWSDVGSWNSLWAIAQKDPANNALSGDVIAMDCRNSLIHNTGKLVAAIGIDDLAIINTPDAVLVAHKDQVQQVKKVVQQLKNSKRTEHLLHREVHRPWGCYSSIATGSRYQVKQLTVKPGASLSLQMHHHRAEHWVVVRGTAAVQVGELEQLITENESVYIPIGEKHRLSNPGKMPLELIEVQSGSYLDEDDIVRFEDLYQRIKS
jgi:mannose-1-phosphate guanylyltransferase/mannose-6-phosphate isomerase